MNTYILIKSAFHSLRHHKGRSALTILGIVIGISAIIATLAIGYGAEEKMKKTILAIGNNYVEMWAGNFLLQGITKSKRKKPKRLREDDIKSLKLQLSDIRAISPVFFVRTNIEHQGTQIVAQTKGGNEHFISILGRVINKGSNFSHYQVKKGSRVIILGHKAAKDLFKSVNPIGKTVSIKNMLFTVVGTAKEIKHYKAMNNPNLDVFMPYTASKKYLQKTRTCKIHGIVLSAKNQETMSQLVRNMRKIMRTRHHLELDDPDDFSIIDQQSMLKAAKASSGIFNIFLLIVASISLLVGGIGVMNIMLVSVTERTQEIGIRMALGAPRVLILRQFLIESVALCFIGGTIGIALGMITPFAAHLIAGFPVVLKLQPIIIAFFTIFLIGIIFGYYPARKASLLHPVEALIKT